MSESKTKIKTSLPTIKFLKKDANQFFFLDLMKQIIAIYLQQMRVSASRA